MPILRRCTGTRVIARPFIGQPGAWVRTPRRKDFSLPPPGPTLLDRLVEQHVPRVGVGKVDDLFAGRGISNPAGAIWSATLLLEHLMEGEAAAALMSALEDVCRAGPKTRDVGGTATTREVGDAVAERVAPRRA